MDPTEAFAELASGPEDRVDLAEGALLIAAHAYPGLEVSAELRRLDELASGCPGASVDDLRSYLFGALGFRGNTDDYEDPRNSFLNDVLDRRLGIPISLSVVVIEVGRRLGLDPRGVGMPGHFLVRVAADPPRFLDAFNRGRLLGVPECRALYRRLYGERVPFHPRFLDAVGPHAILARMLANLRAIYAARNDIGQLLWVLRLRTMLPGVPPEERRDLAVALAGQGRFLEAADELEDLAMQLRDQGEARKVLVASRAVRARLN